MEIIDHQKELDTSLDIIRDLTTENGAVVSSKTGHYNSVWIRDNLMVSYALALCGHIEEETAIVSNVLEIMMRYSEKLESINVLDDPFSARTFVPSRFSRDSHSELEQEISYLHLDLPGILLFKLADLATRGHDLVDTEEKTTFLQTLVTFVESMEYTDTLEYGIWEEGPELHTSTIACVVAGLESAGNVFKGLKINKKMLERGRKRLEKLLPEESLTRPVDFCLLGVVWPFNLISGPSSRELIEKVTSELEKRKGLIRYSEDGYYNPRPDSPRGTEPRWPLGFAWAGLAWLHLASVADETQNGFGSKEELIARGLEYITKCGDQKTFNGQIPELISGGEPNINTPFAWAQAFYAAGHAMLMKFRQSAEESGEAGPDN